MKTHRLTQLKKRFDDHVFNGQRAEDFFRSRKLTRRTMFELLQHSINSLINRGAVAEGAV